MNDNIIKRIYHKLYVRTQVSEPDKISFEFHYPVDGSSPFKKHFKFIRSKNEEINSFLSRIKIKVNVEFTKMIKRKEKNNPDAVNLFTEYLLNEVSVKHSNPNKIINDYGLLHESFVENTILKLNTTEYIAVLNTPTIVSIKLPKVIISDCPVIPIVNLEHGDMSDIHFEWFISPNSCKWQSVHNGLIFTPSKNWVGYFVKVVSSCDRSEQRLEVQSKSAIIECPEQKALNCRWKLTPNFVDGHGTLRLMTYNILANIYSETKKAKEEIFRHCNEEWLSMDYRQHLILNEITKYRCDIICLQEVDNNLYESLWLPAMTYSGYNGLLNSKVGTAGEGQAIFWRQSKFKLVSNMSLPSLSDYVLNDKLIPLASIRNVIISSGESLQQWMELKQGMVGCVLQAIDDQTHQLMIANTHLYFRPDAQIWRLFQMAAIICRLDTIKKEYPLARILLCGDFNDYRSSPVIDFIEQASIKVPYNNESVDLRHNHRLISAYKADFTNYTINFAAELDFIYYDQNGLLCENTLHIPSLAEVTENVALPNKDFPSDHLCLVAQFKIV